MNQKTFDGLIGHTKLSVGSILICFVTFWWFTLRSVNSRGGRRIYWRTPSRYQIFEWVYQFSRDRSYATNSIKSLGDCEQTSKALWDIETEVSSWDTHAWRYVSCLCCSRTACYKGDMQSLDACWISMTKVFKSDNSPELTLSNTTEL